MQKKKIEQMVSIRITIYKESIRKSIIYFLFSMPLFLKRFFYYKIAKDFDYDLDHQTIWSK